MQKKCRPPSIALVGLGYWGRNILKTLRCFNLLRLVVYDNDPKRLRDTVVHVPTVETAVSFTAILKDPYIDAICIASPVESHIHQVKASLAAGKHVFVEKPLGRTYKEASSLIGFVRKYHKHVMVGHIYIHHPAILELKRWIASGLLGEIRWIRSTRCSLGPRIRNDVDVLWDYAIHDIYLVPFILNERVCRVRADGRSHLKQPRADWVEFSLEFENSKTVMHGFVSWLNPFKERMLMFVGSKGIAVFDELRHPCLTFYQCGFKPYSGADSWGNDRLRLFDKGKKEFSCKTDQTLSLELQHFIEHLTKRSPPHATLQDGLTTLCLLETLSSSLARNGAWISAL